MRRTQTRPNPTQPQAKTQEPFSIVGNYVNTVRKAYENKNPGYTITDDQAFSKGPVKGTLKVSPPNPNKHMSYAEFNSKVKSIKTIIKEQSNKSTKKGQTPNPRTVLAHYLEKNPLSKERNTIESILNLQRTSSDPNYHTTAAMAQKVLYS